MRITLLRTGGIIPVTKKAEKNVDWTSDELSELIKVIKNEEGAGQKRDATGYQLKYNAGTFSIDWEKIPAKYKKTFEELKDDLAIVKP
ncbi:hypothetical protein [Segetibacter sp.]|jgi:hypothetical protein|uniref:hypothetical protein n=1 Tax=Segetibacter sp. TaxID=2231182 RepID=UPI002624377A|nr:hypothetical protein [Segetibacter sp.]MCW3081439.1 hypothetical protein [Segetibacter sp.]